MEFKQDELLTELKDILGSEWNESIKECFIYRHHIVLGDVTTNKILRVLPTGVVLNPYLFHAFLVVKTENWWYSAEKCAEGVFLQVLDHSEIFISEAEIFFN